jgi:DNA-binding NarL/FixJ family response regulator
VKKLRIFLAEDHTVVREGLKLLVNTQADMEVIGEAGDGRTALQKAKDLQPDVVVMDVAMPELSGDQAAQQLKQAIPEIKILALSVHEDKSYLHRLLQAGASGYVLKRAAAEELINAIRVVAEGGVYLDPSLASKFVNGFLQNPARNSPGRENALSTREDEVIRQIAEGYSNKEIAADLDISVKTVETYKARAMEKLGLHSRAEIVRFALQSGWFHDS